MPKIQIANPLPGSAKYTSVHRAARYIARGIAVWDCGQLRFLDEDQRRLMRHVDLALHQQAQTERRRSDAYVDGKVIWHNGADRRPGAAHIPGENVQFIKPYVAAVRLGL